jgi:hypothetical protein
LLPNYYSSKQFEKALTQFVEYYNNERYHESLENLAPADICFGKVEDVIVLKRGNQAENNAAKAVLRQQRRSIFLIVLATLLA